MSNNCRQEYISGGARAGGGRAPRLKRILNLRLLAITLIILALVGPTVYIVHQYQIRRTAGDFLDKAEAMAKEGKWAESADYLFRYLELRPKDAEARIRLAETYGRAFNDLGGRRRAIDLYYQALGVAGPEQEGALRRELGDLLLENGRFSAAETEARALRSADGDDPAAWRILAFAGYEQYQVGSRSAHGKTDEPLSLVFERAIQLNPGHVKLTSTLASIYRKHNELLDPDKQKLTQAERNSLADGIMDQLVGNAADEAQAYLARYKYRIEFRLPDAERDLHEALRCGPRNIAVLLAAAEDARQKAGGSAEKTASEDEIQDYLEKARGYYERICDAAPADERGYLGLSQVVSALQQPKKAVEILQQGLERCGKEDFSLNASLAETLLSQGELDGASAAIQTLKKARMNIDPAASPEIKAAVDRTCDLLSGQLCLYRGEIREAIPILRRVTVGQRSTSAEVAQTFRAWMLLGKAFSTWRQWDRAAAAYENAVSLQPLNLSAHVAAAQAWTNAGRTDLAIRHYERSLTLSDAPELWLSLASAYMVRELNLAPEGRNWQSFHEALAAAKDPRRKPPLKEPWQVDVLAANYSLLTAAEQGPKADKIKETADFLRSLEKQHPDSLKLQQALAPLYDGMGRQADLERILDSMEKASDKPHPELHIVRARLLSSRKQFDQARDILQTALQKVPKSDWGPLQEELLRVESAAGHADEARELLRQWCTAAPLDLEPVRQLADDALQRGDWEQLQQCEKQFVEREGEGSVSARYYQAHRELFQASKTGSEDFSAAMAAQAYVQNERPQWPAAYVLKGMILEARGNLSQAADAYQEAIRLGEQRTVAYERLIALLSRLDRLEEAKLYLNVLHNSVLGSQSLTGLEVDLAVRRGEIVRALQLAEETAKRHPDDALAKLWLGQMLFADGRISQAEKTLQEAARLAPQEPRVILGLLDFYVSTNRVDAGRRILQDLEEEKNPTPQTMRLLAQGYEFIGALPDADKYYRLAVQNDPKAEAPQIQLAQFLYRKGEEADRAEAEKCMRAVLAQNPLSAPARRLLAQILIDRGGENEWNEAEQLLGADKTGQAASTQNRRMQILALVRRGGAENFAKAQEMLEALIADPTQVSAADRLLMARILELTGRPAEARDQLLRLVRQAHPRPNHLAAYIDLLLRQERLAEASEWLDKMERAAPDALVTAALRARWLRASGRAAEVEPLIEAAAEKLFKRQSALSTADEAAFCQQVGELYLALEQYAPAERWFRRVTKLFPERYESLARAWAQQDRISEAIDLCISAAATDKSARPASTLALTLLLGHPTAEDFRRAEPIIEQALKDHHDDAAFVTQVANLRAVQNRTEDAVSLYQQVLRIRPRDVLVMNNMATLLAEMPARRKEALDCIDGAIRVAGPQPMLLDTKGMILFYDDKCNDAVPILQQAASVPQADPRYAFHLAVVYHKRGDLDQARDALNQAKRSNLDRAVLTSLDRKLLNDLEEKLGQ